MRVVRNNQTPIPRRRTAAASTGSSRHPRKRAACTAGRDPRTRRAPSRRSVPVRLGNRAAGAADAARADDADGPAIAHRRSSNRARSRATPNSRDALPVSPPPSSGQSRADHTTAPNRHFRHFPPICADGLAIGDNLARVCTNPSDGGPRVRIHLQQQVRLSCDLIFVVKNPAFRAGFRATFPAPSAESRSLRHHKSIHQSGLCQDNRMAREGGASRLTG